MENEISLFKNLPILNIFLVKKIDKLIYPKLIIHYISFEKKSKIDIFIENRINIIDSILEDKQFHCEKEETFGLSERHHTKELVVNRFNQFFIKKDIYDFINNISVNNYVQLKSKSIYKNINDYHEECSKRIFYEIYKNFSMMNNEKVICGVNVYDIIIRSSSKDINLYVDYYIDPDLVIISSFNDSSEGIYFYYDDELNYSFGATENFENNMALFKVRY